MNIFSFLRRRKPIPEPWAKYYTKEELNIKIPDISMYDQVKKSAYLYPENIAYEYMGKKCLYKDFINNINEIVKMLLTRVITLYFSSIFLVNKDILYLYK